MEEAASVGECRFCYSKVAKGNIFKTDSPKVFTHFAFTGIFS
jgi:hypothetical protein